MSYLEKEEEISYLFASEYCRARCRSAIAVDPAKADPNLQLLEP